MESRFDVLAKAFAAGMSRRDALRKVGGSVAAATLAAFGIGCETGPTDPEGGGAGHALLDPRGRCKKGDQKCRENSECCSGFCNPTTGKCACGPGTYECAATGICVACDSSTVFEPLSCTCQCPTNTVVCGTPGNVRCCNLGEACVNGACTAVTPCQPGQTSCNGRCVNLSTDVNNCGQCGRVCASGQSCSNGVCTACAPGQTRCNGVCVDLNADPNNCGACGNACSGLPCNGGFVTCNAGQCVCTCGPGTTMCGAQCVDTSTDPGNCGFCGHVCAPGETCVASVCTIACPPGQVACGGVCRDVLTDVNNCGACGNVCSTPNGVPRCTNGVCGIAACNAGFADCDGNPVNGCETNVAADVRNCGGCGIACPQGAFCSGGRCVCPGGQPTCGGTCCPEGLSCCSGNCIDLLFDPANCGACGHVCTNTCPPGAFRECTSGVCTCSF